MGLMIWDFNGLEILHQCDKRVKANARKFFGLIPMFVEAAGEKLVGSVFFPPSSVI